MAAKKFWHGEVEPVLNRWAEKQHGDRNNQTYPKSLTKHLLVTTVINPARHLYERQGFEVVETRTDDVYERMTGIPGRNLMVKELA